ncbi:activated RNA polymerase II transcriptional coactivator p15 [Aplysia californica]|uniref:Activated RNA polymerase II transcriptional coactivator p15 n=1 Tax=Aplysia californica TaxID=6500 RepID=A0ABM0K8Q9_APLCA|nr:activated RNA polymerase II transcriptional coactivator p15 [Aplysia californica]
MSSKSKEFLSSSDSDDSDEPRPKKTKPSKPEKPAAKPEKKEKANEPMKGSGGEYMFQLAKMRYATVGEFRGNVMVGIREYYNDKDGELKPGKKGISLSAEQWRALKDHINDIDETMKKF